MPALGSFRCIVGSAADMSELEYISSLHQTVLPNLREDGTISAKDIAAYLKSRYGLDITPTEAIDIACGLCGAKSKKHRSINKNLKVLNEQAIQLCEDDDGDADEADLVEKDDDGEDSIQYCFDLVQAASLLLIPDIIDCAAEAQTATGDCAAPKNCIFREVLESLIEPLDENMEDDIRSGVPLTVELLSKILFCGGDEDASKDAELMKQMLEDLGGEGAPFSVDTFMSALTSDIISAFSPSTVPAKHDKKSEQDINVGHTHRTSTFFDVFGFNWEDGASLATESGLSFVNTKAYVDYAADAYNSIVYNTCVWSLFLMNTLIYGSYIQSRIILDMDGLVCESGSDHFGCKIGNHVIVWISIALFCGVYGLLFLVPTSIGNIPGKKGWLLFSLAVTGTFCFLPFAALISYHEGIPHHKISTDKHSTVCPVDDTMLEFLPSGTNLHLDDTCKNLRDWCSDHNSEVQGKYVDTNSGVLTEKEFTVCDDFLKTKVPAYFYFTPGDLCNETRDCEVSSFTGDCGLEELSEPYKNVCCMSGKTVPHKYPNGSNIAICSHQKLGATCFSNEMCDSGLCDLVEESLESTSTTFQQCIPKVKEEGPCMQNCPVGSNCTYATAQHLCASGFCYEGTCALEPEVCLDYNTNTNTNDNTSAGLTLGGFVIDPFCRVPEVWCDLNDVEALYAGFMFLNEYLNFTDAKLTELDECTAALTVLIEHNMLKIVNETDENYKFTDDEVDYDAIERTLLSYWSYFVLIATAVLGGMAFLAQLSAVRGMNADQRPRDHAIKCAAKAKMSKLIGNALSLHGKKDSDVKGMTMRNYFKCGRRFANTGGLWWTIHQMRSGALTMSEGIHIPGRVYIGMVCQIVADETSDWGASFQEIRDDISQVYTNDEVQNIADYGWANFDDAELKLTSAEQTILEYVPEQWMIDVPVSIATFFTFFVAVFCILVYIPSYASTVLELRCGKIPSLHDPYIGVFRKMGDGVVNNVGNMVFSLMGASVMTFIIVFISIFIFCWPVTKDVVLTLIAIGIGIAVTDVIKIFGQQFFRARNFSGLYRTRPGSANIVNLFFECWYIGIGLLVIVTRLAIFIVAGALWLGRIDVEFLHPEVKVMGVGLDAIPIAFKRDMLVHEAHSHPYIDRLGGMYLRRLRHGDKFGSVSGSTWRALFVVGLMPWFIKHRVNLDDVILMVKKVIEEAAEIEALEAAK